MSDSQCPVCDQSLDEGSNHTLCLLSTIAAIFVGARHGFGKYSGASCFDQCVEPPEAFFGNTHDEQVAKIRERFNADGGGRIYSEYQGTISQSFSTDGKFLAFARISFCEAGDVQLRTYVCHHPFATQEEAVSAVDDFHEEFIRFCETQGTVTMEEDPSSGRKMN